MSFSSNHEVCLQLGVYLGFNRLIMLDQMQNLGSAQGLCMIRYGWP